ncbi:MAG: nuclear transport factor 2 family protein [Gemmatimonadetes bacterium]|nr:nuclear transport factor 2 family protein [Gemmatimonadota bacterium]
MPQRRRAPREAWSRKSFSPQVGTRSPTGSASAAWARQVSKWCRTTAYRAGPTSAAGPRSPWGTLWKPAGRHHGRLSNRSLCPRAALPGSVAALARLAASPALRVGRHTGQLCTGFLQQLEHGVEILREDGMKTFPLMWWAPSAPTALALSAGLAWILGCASPPAEPGPDPSVIEAELRSFEDAHRAAIDAKDVDRVLAFYAPDLITVSPETGIAHGREWIRSTCETLFRDYDFHEDFTLGDIRIFGDRVAASYTYTQRMAPLSGGEPEVLTGKGVAVLKRSEAGAWQFEWSSYAPDAPAAAAVGADSTKGSA